MAPLAVDTTDEGTQSLKMLADAYKNLKQDSDFLATLKSGIEKLPEDPYFFGNIVDYYVQKEDLNAALELAKEMVAKYPANGYYIYEIGRASCRERV